MFNDIIACYRKADGCPVIVRQPFAQFQVLCQYTGLCSLSPPAEQISRNHYNNQNQSPDKSLDIRIDS